MTVRQLAVDMFLDVGAIHAEGPTWDARLGSLLWVDMHGRHVHQTTPDAIDVAAEYVQRPAAVVPRLRGGRAIALEDGLWLEEPDGALAPLVGVSVGETAHLNDGKCDAWGRLWVGSMAADGRSPIAALYRIDPDGHAATMIERVTISNGLAWDANGTTMFYIDSPTGRLDAFDFDGPRGILGQRRTIVSIPRTLGQPDGMTIDDAGCLWIAMWGGAAVHRYTPEGRLDTIVRLPVSQVTSCAFGGSMLDDLFITTSTLGVPPGRDVVHAGALFQCRTGVTGPSAMPFGG